MFGPRYEPGSVGSTYWAAPEPVIVGSAGVQTRVSAGFKLTLTLDVAVMAAVAGGFVVVATPPTVVIGASTAPAAGTETVNVAPAGAEFGGIVTLQE